MKDLVFRVKRRILPQGSFFTLPLAYSGMTLVVEGAHKAAGQTSES